MFTTTKNNISKWISIGGIEISLTIKIFSQTNHVISDMHFQIKNIQKSRSLPPKSCMRPCFVHVFPHNYKANHSTRKTKNLQNYIELSLIDISDQCNILDCLLNRTNVITNYLENVTSYYMHYCYTASSKLIFCCLLSVSTNLKD